MHTRGMLANATNNTAPLEYVKCLNIYHLTSPPKGSTLATYLAVSSILAVLSVVTSLGNGLVIYVYFKQKSLQHSNIFLLICLAFMDFFTGVLLEPLYTIRLLSEIFGFTSCVYILIVRRLFEFLRPVSFITLALITTERYLALFRPVTHRRLVTKKRLLGTVLCSWLVWFSLVLIRSFYTEVTPAFYAISTFIVIALLIVNVGMYFKIGRLARFHGKSVRPTISYAHSDETANIQSRKIGVQPAERSQQEEKSLRQSNQLDIQTSQFVNEPRRASGEPLKPHNSIKPAQGSFTSHEKKKKALGGEDLNKRAEKREKYATWTVFYIVFALTVCYIPESVLLVYVSLSLDNLDFDLLFIYVHITETIVMFNALVNPFIYCLRNRKMRAAVKACWGIGKDARTRAARRSGESSQSEGK